MCISPERSSVAQQSFYPSIPGRYPISDRVRSAVLPLIEIFETDDYGPVRMYAAQSLGKLRDERVVEPLIAVFMNTTRGLDRTYAARALGEIQDERAVEPLIAALKKEEHMPYYTGTEYDFPSGGVEGTATALGKIGNRRAISPLVQALGDDMISGEAASALAMFGEPAVDPLLEALKRPSNSCQLDGAITALGLIGDTRATEPLIEIMKKEHNPAVPVALGTIKDSRAVQPLVEQLPLLKTLEGTWVSELSYRQKVVKALGEIGPDARDAVPALIELVQNPKERGKSAEEPTRYDKSRDTVYLSGGEVSYFGAVREAIDALGNIGDERALPVLETLSHDPDSSISGRAKEALRKIKARAD